MSCDTEYLKKQLLIFSETCLRRFVLCAIVLMNFAQTFRKILANFTESKTQNFQKDVDYVPKNCFENFLRSLYLEQYVFFVRMQSQVSAAPDFEGYVWYFGSLHPAFEMSCAIEYL